MIDMPEGRSEDRGMMGDPVPAPDSAPRDPTFSRGATDLVISLSAKGRTIRLFTADGDGSRTPHLPRNLGLGLEENGTDR